MALIGLDGGDRFTSPLIKVVIGTCPSFPEALQFSFSEVLNITVPRDFSRNGNVQ